MVKTVDLAFFELTKLLLDIPMKTNKNDHYGIKVSSAPPLYVAKGWKTINEAEANLPTRFPCIAVAYEDLNIYDEDSPVYEFADHYPDDELERAIGLREVFRQLDKDPSQQYIHLDRQRIVTIILGTIPHRCRLTDISNDEHFIFRQQKDLADHFVGSTGSPPAIVPDVPILDDSDKVKGEDMEISATDM